MFEFVKEKATIRSRRRRPQQLTPTVEPSTQLWLAGPYVKPRFIGAIGVGVAGVKEISQG